AACIDVRFGINSSSIVWRLSTSTHNETINPTPPIVGCHMASKARSQNARLYNEVQISETAIAKCVSEGQHTPADHHCRRHIRSIPNGHLPMTALIGALSEPSETSRSQAPA